MPWPHVTAFLANCREHCSLAQSLLGHRITNYPKLERTRKDHGVHLGPAGCWDLVCSGSAQVAPWVPAFVSPLWTAVRFLISSVYNSMENHGNGKTWTFSALFRLREVACCLAELVGVGKIMGGADRHCLSSVSLRKIMKYFKWEEPRVPEVVWECWVLSWEPSWKPFCWGE